MTPELVFKIANSAGLLAWIFLVGAARWMPRTFRIVRWGFPIALAVVYLAALFLSEPSENAGFGSLAGVTALFDHPWAVVAGWVHYLAFDFFVGCWILEAAIKNHVAHWFVIGPLILTFLLGPVGLLLFLILLGLRKRKARLQTS